MAMQKVWLGSEKTCVYRRISTLLNRFCIIFWRRYYIHVNAVWTSCIISIMLWIFSSQKIFRKYFRTRHFIWRRVGIVIVQTFLCNAFRISFKDIILQTVKGIWFLFSTFESLIFKLFLPHFGKTWKNLT